MSLLLGPRSYSTHPTCRTTFPCWTKRHGCHRCRSIIQAVYCDDSIPLLHLLRVCLSRAIDYGQTSWCVYLGQSVSLLLVQHVRHNSKCFNLQCRDKYQVSAHVTHWCSASLPDSNPWRRLRLARHPKIQKKTGSKQHGIQNSSSLAIGTSFFLVSLYHDNWQTNVWIPVPRILPLLAQGTFYSNFSQSEHSKPITIVCLLRFLVGQKASKAHHSWQLLCFDRAATWRPRNCSPKARPRRSIRTVKAFKVMQKAWESLEILWQCWIIGIPFMPCHNTWWDACTWGGACSMGASRTCLR